MMRIKIINSFVVLILVFFFAQCVHKSEKGAGKKERASITVFAAASLTDVLSELVDSFEINTNIKVNLNMASSGTLARQIEQGELPDIYLSASKNWADYIDNFGYKVDEYRSVVALNDLVLIAPGNSSKSGLKLDSTLNISEILGSSRLSMGDPLHVPAGKYAKQVLIYYGWYEGLKSKILPAKDVRSALMMVEMGEAPLGIVYRTDALKSGKVKILASFPSYTHEPITYVGLVCKNSEPGIEFFKYLNSDEVSIVISKYGFKQLN